MIFEIAGNLRKVNFMGEAKEKGMYLPTATQLAPMLAKSRSLLLDISTPDVFV